VSAWNIKTLWLVIWLHPLLKCPLCDGTGGAMEGYYEPEWCECDCWPRWEPLEDGGLSWFVGRLPLLEWLRAQLSVRLLKLYTIVPFREILRCKIGYHAWMAREFWPEPNVKVCATCFESATEQPKEGKQ